MCAFLRGLFLLSPTLTKGLSLAHSRPSVSLPFSTAQSPLPSLERIHTTDALCPMTTLLQKHTPDHVYPLKDPLGLVHPYQGQNSAPHSELGP